MDVNEKAFTSPSGCALPSPVYGDADKSFRLRQERDHGEAAGFGEGDLPDPYRGEKPAFEGNGAPADDELLPAHHLEPAADL